MKICFRVREDMEKELGWLDKSDTGIWENVTMFGECLRVNSYTLEIEQANGYEHVVGRLLCEGKLNILK